MHRSSRSSRRAFRLLTSALALSCALGTAPAFAGRVFVDPGHGGPYPGAVSGGVTEAYVNLMLGIALRDALAARGHTVAMSRTANVSPNLADIPTWHYAGDGTLGYYADGRTGVYDYTGGTSAIPYDDLQSRCDLANRFGADVFISIHCDSSTGSSASGTATYRNWDNETDAQLSNRLAQLVQTEMMTATTPYYAVENDGTKVVGFYVTRWANMPAALVETAFLSNPYERALLLDPQFRARIASGMAKGIDRFLAENPFTPRWHRISGATRYGTAAQVAAQGWPAGADTVLLVSGEDWPDALAATPLSSKLDAPLLLTAAGSLPAETRAALASLSPSQVVVLGGQAAVSDTATVEAAAAAGLPLTNVRRIAGVNRYETSALIAQEVGVPSTGRIMLVSGESYADAVSASAQAGSERTPILLTQRSELPTAVAEYWAEHPNATRGYVIGGNTVVADTLVLALRDGTSGLPAKTLTRIWGRDRYATNIAVLKAFWPSGTVQPYVATAVAFPDALTAGTLAARRGEPIVLLGGRFMSPYTREWLANNEARVGDFTFAGGPAALPYLMDWQVEKGLAR